MNLTEDEALFGLECSIKKNQDVAFLDKFKKLAKGIENEYAESNDKNLYAEKRILYLKQLFDTDDQLPDLIIGKGIISYDVEIIRDLSYDRIHGKYAGKNSDCLETMWLLKHCYFYLNGRFGDIKIFNLFPVEKFAINVRKGREDAFLSFLYLTLATEAKKIECNFPTFVSHFDPTAEFLLPIKWLGSKVELAVLFRNLGKKRFITNSSVHKVAAVNFYISKLGDLKTDILENSCSPGRPSANIKNFPWIQELLKTANREFAIKISKNQVKKD